MSQINRPAQKSQPSRKGKRAWRKHIDLDDVDSGLEQARDLERTVGTDDLGTVESTALFAVDTAGDDGLVSINSRKQFKSLKADEILARRSAIPALKAEHKKKATEKTKAKGIQGVSGKEVNRLMRVAGRGGPAVSSSLASIEKDGVTDASAYDIWGAPEAKKAEPVKHISYSKSASKPSTLDHAPEAPIPGAKPVELPDEGRSYNPSVESWKALIEREHAKEEDREKERQKALEEKERVEHLIQTLDIKEVVESDDDEDEDEGAEKEEEEGDEGELQSVNKAVVVKTKTRYERNKQRRHKERIDLEQQLKELKQQIRDLENLPRLLKEEAERLAKREEQAQQPKKSNKRKKFTKHNVMEPSLDVKLSDELIDCLRRLRPEGNLARDRFRSLQERGLIEPRIALAKRRKYTPKVTEKWTYKDIKL